MFKTETLDELFGARDSITDQIIALTPRNDGDQAKLAELMKQRDRLTAKINEVIEAPFTNSKDDAPLRTAVSRLEEAAKQLKALKKTMDDIAQVIDIADQVVKLAASIIALAA
ncbi:MAG: hypothetical protein QM820_10970 [Minicystis sp.]